MTTDAHGVIRVSGTRVPLDTAIASFNEGATPEEIAWQYPSLHLADVYSVITYYLHHREEVDAYVREREQLRQAVQRD